MVKDPKKPRQKQNNTINSVLTENKTPLKTKQQIDKEYYQKNKEHKKQQRRELYAHQKKQGELTTQQQSAQYYETENIRVLMSLKEFTELNPAKKKLWADFCWTFKDFKKVWESGIADIIPIMKVREVADQLINDYWATAKEKIQQGKNWNIISEEQQQKLIRYWGYEKARRENNFLTTSEQLEQQGKEYEKELELAKFHEERGKVKCDCYSCAEQKKIQGEIKKEIVKESKVKKVQCPNVKKMLSN